MASLRTHGQSPLSAAQAHYTGEQLEAALRAVGLRAGDTVFSHVGMGMLGYPKEGAVPEAMSEVVCKAFLNVLGPKGTWLVPTYSYSLCHGEVYDPASTPSAVGPFSEAFRRRDGVVRSSDPIFPVSAVGPKAAALFRDLPHECFGEDCLYDRLVKADAKICNIGVGFRYATFIHYIEQSEDVPYRFLKRFTGRVRLPDGSTREESWIYKVRILLPNCSPDLSRLEALAERRGKLRRAIVGRGEVTCIDCRDMDRLCREGVSKDYWFMAKGPIIDLAGAELKRLPEPAGATTVLDDLCRDLIATQYQFPSGTRVGAELIPERVTAAGAAYGLMKAAEIVVSGKSPRARVWAAATDEDLPAAQKAVAALRRLAKGPKPPVTLRLRLGPRLALRALALKFPTIPLEGSLTTLTARKFKLTSTRK